MSNDFVLQKSLIAILPGVVGGLGGLQRGLCMSFKGLL
jgi:hypothetical protein